MEANVTQIYKKQAHMDLNNYRPISLISKICKHLDKIIKLNTISWLTTRKKNNLQRNITFLFQIDRVTFLTSRRQRVVLGNTVLDRMLIMNGVPQGSTIGHTFFAISINKPRFQPHLRCSWTTLSSGPQFIHNSKLKTDQSSKKTLIESPSDINARACL